MARLIKGGTLVQHIPRTGGTTIARMIDDLKIPNNNWLNHQSNRIVKKHALLHQYWRSRLKHVKFVVAFVRHPVAYYESTWKWLATCNGLGFMSRKYDWHPFVSAARWYRGDFNAWVEHMLANEPCWCTRLFEAYIGPEGGECCDFIGRTETLAEDFISVLKIVDYPDYKRLRREIRRYPKRNTRKIKLQWSPHLKAEVERMERTIIRRFYEGDAEQQRPQVL